MSDLTPLEVLTNIKDAASSESIAQLFGIVRKAVSETDDLDFTTLLAGSVVEMDALREDVAIETSESERQIIIDNFPLSKNNYLVVPKVIEE